MTFNILKVTVYKVLLNQILNAKKLEQPVDQAYDQWHVLFKCKSDMHARVSDTCFDTRVLVSNVWIQGKILYVNEDSLTLDDGTGIALVTGVSKLPQTTKNFEINLYVMVVGYICNVGPLPLPVHMSNCFLKSDMILSVKLKALKVTNISDNANCRKGVWWKNEVLQAQTDVLLSDFR